ncbi:MAG: hypothetical protein ACRERU_08240 [Methylococcales bacterium]
MKDWKFNDKSEVRAEWCVILVCSWQPPEAEDAMRAGRDMKAAIHDAHPCASPGGRLSAVQIGYPADLSPNADVAPVAALDRAGLERLLRYCARALPSSPKPIPFSVS